MCVFEMQIGSVLELSRSVKLDDNPNDEHSLIDLWEDCEEIEVDDDEDYETDDICTCDECKERAKRAGLNPAYFRDCYVFCINFMPEYKVFARGLSMTLT